MEEDENEVSLINNEDLLCIICQSKSLLELDQLMSYPCGHTTCVGCGKDWNDKIIKTMDGIKCPSCNVILDKVDFKIFNIDKRWKSVLRDINSKKRYMERMMRAEIKKREEEELKFKGELELKSKENEELMKKREEILKEKERMDQEMMQSRRMLRTEKKKRQEEEEKNEGLMKENERMQREIRQKEMQIEKINEEIEEGRKNLDEERENVNLKRNQMSRELEEEREKIEQERIEMSRELKEERDKIEQERIELYEEIEQIKLKQVEIKRLKERTENEKNQVEEENRRILLEKEKMEEERDQMEKENEQILEDKQRIEMEKQNLEEENERILKEKERIMQEKYILKQENKRMKEHNEKIEREFQQIKEIKEENDIVISKQEKENLKMKKNMELLKKESDEVGKQKHSLESKMRELENQLESGNKNNSEELKKNQELYEKLKKTLLDVKLEFDTKNERYKELEEKFQTVSTSNVSTPGSTQVGQVLSYTARYFTDKISPLNLNFVFNSYKLLIGDKENVGMLKKNSSEFTILERRGSNLKSPVFKAKFGNELVAVKKIYPEYSTDRAKDIFKQAMIVNILNPYIDGVVLLKGIFIKDNFIHLVYPYYEFDLEYLIFQNTLNDKNMFRLDTKQKTNISMQLIETVYELHKFGICHRDIRPSSILCYRNVDNWYPVLCSWNFSSFERDSKSYNSPSYYRYKPPEYFYGKVSNWRSFDVWTLGCVLAELFLDEHLFYIWNEKKKDALEAIFAWKECIPQNPQEFLQDYEESIPKSLLAALLEKGIVEWLAQLICSFLSFDSDREIVIDHDNFEIKPKNYTAINLEDQYIPEWIKKHYEN